MHITRGVDTCPPAPSLGAPAGQGRAMITWTAWLSRHVGNDCKRSKTEQFLLRAQNSVVTLRSCMLEDASIISVISTGFH